MIRRHKKQRQYVSHNFYASHKKRGQTNAAVPCLYKIKISVKFPFGGGTLSTIISPNNI